MQLVKLTEEQLKNISSGINLQRAENYVGKFINCSVDDSFIKGTIRGNHGDYTVTLKIDVDPIEYSCDCEKGKDVFCKHAAALGLTYIYTPWVFSSNQIIDRKSLRTTDEIKFYIKTTPLKQLLDDLKTINVSVSQLADLSGIPIKRIAALVKDDSMDTTHNLTDPLKLSCLFLLEKYSA
jgi:hypothetical protein